MDVKETELRMLAAFDNFRTRVERLELARQHQSAINSLHIKLTLDPENSSRDGTADKLIKLISQENVRARDDFQFSHLDYDSPTLPAEEGKLRTEARRNKTHFSNLLKSEDNIPAGEPLEFGDLTEFEVASNEASEDMSKLTDANSETHENSISKQNETFQDEDPETVSQMEIQEAIAVEGVQEGKHTKDAMVTPPRPVHNTARISEIEVLDDVDSIETLMSLDPDGTKNKEGWVTLPNKRSPRHNPKERDSKTH